MHCRVLTRRRARWAGALLSMTWMTPAFGVAALLVPGVAVEAWADGGAGGNADVGSGGAGGIDSLSGTGATGGFATGDSGGGGGGAGASGGSGSSGGGGGGGAGGSGGSSPGGNGGNGGGGVDLSGGGGGGGGGGHGAITSIMNNGGTLQGGTGGLGGSGVFGHGGGGGGGGGGYGAVVSGTGASSNSGIITGGSGGGGGAGDNSVLTFSADGGGGGVGVRFTAGGSFTSSASGTIGGGAGGAGGTASDSTGGNGGAGGAGIVGTGLTVVSGSAISGGNGGAGGGSNNTVGNGGAGGAGISGSGLTITNNGSITGGNGGAHGAFGTGGTDGAGAAGITGSGLTVINSGAITGGLAGDGVTQANAITFTGGTNVLELRSGASFIGNVVAFGATDTLRLGGSTNATFDTSQIGAAAQFQTFGVFEKTGTSTWTLTSAPGVATPWTITQGALAVANVASLGGGALTFNGGTLQALGTLGLTDAIAINAGGGTIDTNGNNVIVSSAISGIGGLTKNGAGELRLAAVNTYGGGTTITAGTLVLDSVGGSLPAGGALTVNGGLFDMSEIATGQTVGALAGTGGQINLGANNLTANSSASTTLATQIIGTGALIKQGAGTLTLTGNNLYSGGTSIQGGLINFNALSNFGTGAITLNGGGLQWASGNTLDISSRLVLGAGGATFDTNGNNVSFATGLTGTGGITKQGSGILNLLANSTYTGLTSVTGGTLAVNGSIASNVTVGPAGTLGGTGTIFGTVTNAGTLAPGNSIGTLNITGSFVQAAGGIYQVEANAAGQADRVNATGTATINGGTVQVIAAAGSYGASTTYTILNATGGRTGTYTGVTSNFAFLTPSLSYDANNVFLTLALGSNAFSGFGGNTPNQRAVGWALDASFATASGDFAAVVGALAGLNTVQGPLALTAISGEPWADFGTMNINNSAMFMNAVAQQMANARNASAAGTRVALAQACDVAACEPVGPLSAWISGLGGLGSVLGDGNASTLTYNFGGAAVGMDWRLDPRFLVGLSAAYTSGTQWVNGFQGKGWTNSVALAAYGSFTPSGSLAGFYADALAGWANFTNQLQRQIQIPGLQPRQANGSTSANQFLGQVEGGYRFGVYAPAAATITPFARFTASSVTQNALSEWGANSLSLNVQQQTTNSLRTTVGAEFGSSIGIGNQRAVDLALRLGWQHEFAYTGRPITSAFAGAPSNSFTVYGATPQPDAAVIGFSASTTVAAVTQLYLRYDGEIGNGTDNHALNLGVRISW